MNEIPESLPNWINIIFGLASVISLIFTLINFGILFNITRKIKNKKSMKVLNQNISDYIVILKRGGDVPSDIMNRIKETTSKIENYYTRLFNGKLYKYISQINKVRKVTEDNVDNIIENLDLIQIEIEDVI